jgi:hypothetical protein
VFLSKHIQNEILFVHENIRPGRHNYLRSNKLVGIKIPKEVFQFGTWKNIKLQKKKFDVFEV